MTRFAFVLPALAFIASSPAGASDGKQHMSIDSLLADMHAKGSRASSMTVRHVGALVSTLTSLRLEQLAADKPIATTHDLHIIEATFDAVRAAEPTITSTASEQRWHLTFADSEDKKLLVVSSSIFAPRHGTIDGRNVLFGNDRLTAFLKKTFAPNELE